jgi:hypothetical protein
MAGCRKCGRGEGNQAEPGLWLERVNPVGQVPAVWECRPSCDASLSPDEAVLAAVGAMAAPAPEPCSCGPQSCCPRCCPVHWRPDGSRRNEQ